MPDETYTMHHSARKTCLFLQHDTSVRFRVFQVEGLNVEKRTGERDARRIFFL